MTDNIKEIIEKYINDKLILAVASNPATKGEGLPSRVKIRPVLIKGRLLFQATKTVGAQELHENHDLSTLTALIGNMIDNGPHFGQLELKNADGSATVLISRKGHVTIKERKVKQETDKNSGKCGTSLHGTAKGGISLPAAAIGGPDREKNYILREGIPVPFLVELGVMNKEGYVVKARYDKFRQINRYLEFVDDVLPELKNRKRNSDRYTEKTKESDTPEQETHIEVVGESPERDAKKLEIIDFGCGKSYLTFALYHFLHEMKGLDVHITGLDLKKDVIADCSRLAQRLGYTDLEFKHGDIADYETTGGVDMVVTLHACDTATDYALYNAIRWNAGVIFCVPCCQHELNKQIRNKELEPVLKYGIIKERISALITDAMRAAMLEEQGYKTQILEFIDMEHTPKNLLIRAVKKNGYKSMGSSKKNGVAGIYDKGNENGHNADSDQGNEYDQGNENDQGNEYDQGSEYDQGNEYDQGGIYEQVNRSRAEDMKDYERLLSDLSSELTLHSLLKNSSK